MSTIPAKVKAPVSVAARATTPKTSPDSETKLENTTPGSGAASTGDTKRDADTAGENKDKAQSKESAK